MGRATAYKAMGEVGGNMKNDIGYSSQEVTCVCLYDKGDHFEGWRVEILAWRAAWGMVVREVKILSWYDGLELKGREFIDDDMAWADVIAYAESKWEELQVTGSQKG